MKANLEIMLRLKLQDYERSAVRSLKTYEVRTSKALGKRRPRLRHLFFCWT